MNLAYFQSWFKFRAQSKVDWCKSGKNIEDGIRSHTPRKKVKEEEKQVKILFLQWNCFYVICYICTYFSSCPSTITDITVKQIEAESSSVHSPQVHSPELIILRLPTKRWSRYLRSLMLVLKYHDSGNMLFCIIFVKICT